MREGFTEDNWHYLICDMVGYYQGGLQYEYAKRMTLSELFLLKKQAVRMNKEIKDAQK